LKAVAGACAGDVFDYCSLFAMRASQSTPDDRILKPLNQSYDTKTNEWKIRAKQNRAIDCNADLSQIAEDWKKLPENKRPPSFKTLLGKVEEQQRIQQLQKTLPRQSQLTPQQQPANTPPAPVARPQMPTTQPAANAPFAAAQLQQCIGTINEKLAWMNNAYNWKKTTKGLKDRDSRFEVMKQNIAYGVSQLQRTPSLANCAAAMAQANRGVSEVQGW